LAEWKVLYRYLTSLFLGAIVKLEAPFFPSNCDNRDYILKFLLLMGYVTLCCDVLAARVQNFPYLVTLSKLCSCYFVAGSVTPVPSISCTWRMPTVMCSPPAWDTSSSSVRPLSSHYPTRYPLFFHFGSIARNVYSYRILCEIRHSKVYRGTLPIPMFGTVITEFRTRILVASSGSRCYCTKIL
jgi:hypothetical protein